MNLNQTNNIESQSQHDTVTGSSIIVVGAVHSCMLDQTNLRMSKLLSGQLQGLHQLALQAIFAKHPAGVLSLQQLYATLPSVLELRPGLNSTLSVNVAS